MANVDQCGVFLIDLFSNLSVWIRSLSVLEENLNLGEELIKVLWDWARKQMLFYFSERKRENQ